MEIASLRTNSSRKQLLHARAAYFARGFTKRRLAFRKTLARKQTGFEEGIHSDIARRIACRRTSLFHRSLSDRCRRWITRAARSRSVHRRPQNG